MGVLFQNFTMRTPEDCEKWAYISRKFSQMGTLFSQIYHLPSPPPSFGIQVKIKMILNGEGN